MKDTGIEPYRKLFARLSAEGIQLQGLATVVQRFEYARTPAAAAPAALRCLD